MINNNVNVCLIGTGRAGMIHAKNLNTRVPNANLIAICDTSQESLEKAKENLSVKYTYNNYEEALDNEEIDAVVIVTPTKLHKDIVIKAAKKKKHILCEKPLARTVEDCDEMIKVVNQNNVKLQVGFMRRFDESFREAKKVIDSGELGEIVLVKSLTRGPSKPQPWMYDINISGGPIAEVNSHDLDTVRWFSDSEVKSIYSIGGNFRLREIAEKYPDFYDTVSMNIELEDGMIAAIDGAQYVQYGYDARVEILGTHGNLMLGDTKRNNITQFSKNGIIKNQFIESWRDLFSNAYLNEDIAFVNAVLNDTQPFVTGKDGRQAVKLVRMGIDSLLSGKPVFA